MIIKKAWTMEERSMIKIGLALVFHVTHILAKDLRVSAGMPAAFDEAEKFMKEAEKRLEEVMHDRSD